MTFVRHNEGLAQHCLISIFGNDKIICDLLWRNKEQIAGQMFPRLGVQYIAWPIGPTLCIQPDNTHIIHAVRSGVTPFIIVKVYPFVIDISYTASR